MRRFRPRLLPTLLVLLAVPGFVRLGIWQVHRDEVRNELRANMIANEEEPGVGVGELGLPLSTLIGRRVVLSGEFVGPVLVEEGRPDTRGEGYGLIQAFEAGNSVILVDRGWAPDAAQALPQTSVVSGVIVPLPRGTAPGSHGRFPPGSGEGMRASVPGALDLLVIEGFDGKIPERDWTSFAYAVQWFVLALGALGAWFWHSLPTSVDAR